MNSANTLRYLRGTTCGRSPVKSRPRAALFDCRTGAARSETLCRTRRGATTMERSLSPASLALDRQERMYDLYDMVCSGEIRLEQAFMKLGLGFAPAVNERAVAFAVTSSEAFTDLFNACVDEQATQLGRTPMQRSASQELNLSGAAHVTVFSGAEPDDIHHEHFQNAPNNQKSDLVRPRRPSVNKLVPQANPQLDESAMEALSVKPVKVRRERRLSVDADRLCIDALIDDDSGRSLAATVFEDELGGAATAARRKERRRSTDGSIMAGVRTQYAPHPRPSTRTPPPTRLAHAPLYPRPLRSHARAAFAVRGCGGADGPIGPVGRAAGLAGPTGAA